MKLETLTSSGAVVSELENQPILRIDTSEVENSRAATGVLKLEVENDEGVHATFWVSVKMKNGRPVAEISTEPSEGKFVRKSVMGTCNRL